MQILPGIHRFDTGPFNWYVIEQAGRLTLIDAGFPGHYSIFAKGVREIGRELSDLEAILLTHSHADHTGFASRLQRELGVPIFIHGDDIAAAQRTLELPWFGLLTNSWRANVRTMLLHATWNGVFRGPTIRDAYAISDQDQLEVPGRPMVFHIPGHTPGEVAFYLPEHKALVSGDTLVTRNLLNGVDGPPQVPNRCLNGNDKQARESIDRFRELGEVTILPGHGKPWSGTMRDALELANARCH